MSWVVEVTRTRTQLRIPVTRRGEFKVVSTPADSRQIKHAPAGTQGSTQAPSSPSVAKKACEEDVLTGLRRSYQEQPNPISVHEFPQEDLARRKLREAFDSLRRGLPPRRFNEARKLLIGTHAVEESVRRLLEEVLEHGGGVRIVRGAYGSGKTMSLNLASELALQSGYWVVQTEVDASERRLDKPSNVYRGLMQKLRLPGGRLHGVTELAALVSELVRRRVGSDGHFYHRNVASVRMWLNQELGCPPLAWLLCDPDLPNKEMLRGLLEGDSGWPITSARNQHVIPGTPQDWPKFSAGSQGDFACFLLSGLGRLARLLGHKGLVVILDEMEKWEDLSWSQQTRAGNFIGGLIWGATEAEGRRQRGTWQRPNIYQPQPLQHSGRAGGFPFTTPQRCHIGLLIALTPRGDEGPEELWRKFGSLAIFDLPEFSVERLVGYVEAASACYAEAYGVPLPDVRQIEVRAHALWAQGGDASARAAVRATIEALDEWHQRRT